MQDLPIPPETLDHLRIANTVDVSEAPHSAAAIPGYRCKVYRARLNLERDRHTAALSRNTAHLFPKGFRKALD